MRTGRLRLDPADLELFSMASHDRNPLHVSEAYAHRTPYGQRVVFGILGALGAMRHLETRSRDRIRRVRIEFRHPLFLDVEYRVEIDDTTPDAVWISVHDADRLMMTLLVAFEPDAGASPPAMPTEVPARQEPADRSFNDLRAGLSVRGTYGPVARDVDLLMTRWMLHGKGIARAHVAALLWSSYLVGMELPGKRALFWSVEMTFPPPASAPDGPLAYGASIVRSDPTLGFVEAAAELSCGEVPFANVRLRAFVRRDSPVVQTSTLRAMLPAADRLAGKVAVVVGGSRGLGAAVVQALALQGCHVLAGYRRSTDDATRVATGLQGASGHIDMIPGDAADPAWYRNELHAHLAPLGGPDILICNAAPPIRPLGLTLDEMERFSAFTSTSLALVAVPMAALLNAVSERRGWCVLISSSYVRSVPADWPHYVAAKAAAEGLAAWAAARHTPAHFLVVRPPTLLTDQTNTPAGQQGAMAVERPAAAIVRRLCEPAALDGVEVMETF